VAESDSLRLFVKERIQRNEYGDVTTSEIGQAYAEFCGDRGWNALGTAVVERTLPDRRGGLLSKCGRELPAQAFRIAGGHCTFGLGVTVAVQ